MRTKGFYDVHCHILPEVDDGAQSLEEAVAMLKIAYRDGIRGILVTPHYYPGRFECSKEEFQQAMELLQKEASQFPEQMELKLGCEVRAYSDAVEQVFSGAIPTMAESNYVLLEFSYGVDARTMIGFVREFAAVGYWPIVAHVERYPVVQKNKNLVAELLDHGSYIQLNASSIMGKHGVGTKWFCKRLLKNGWVHFVASDGHRANMRKPQLSECYQKVSKWCGEKSAEALFVHNPEQLFKGELID